MEYIWWIYVFSRGLLDKITSLIIVSLYVFVYWLLHCISRAVNWLLPHAWLNEKILHAGWSDQRWKWITWRLWCEKSLGFCWSLTVILAECKGLDPLFVWHSSQCYWNLRAWVIRRGWIDCDFFRFSIGWPYWDM